MKRVLVIAGFCSLLFILHLVSAGHGGKHHKSSSADKTHHSTVKMGAILDMKTHMGVMLNACMSMALSDFYSTHSDYRRRLVLHTMHAANALDVASAALQLLNNGVEAIVGSEICIEDYVAELGTKAQIPIISFTPTTLSKPFKSQPYFFQLTPDNDEKHQAQALAAICKHFQWRQVVILYEDNEHGDRFTSNLIKALHRTDIHTASILSIPSLAEESEISGELKRLMSMETQTRVFVVHTTAPLGSRLFVLAKKLGMMSAGYAWIITDALSNSLSFMNSTVTNSMDGVLGIRPYVPMSENLEIFETKWKRTMLSEFNVYCLWAYDTTWALASSIDKIGPKLVQELQGLKLEGLSGKFEIVNRRLGPTAMEVVNIVGTGVRRVGYWLTGKGIREELGSLESAEKLKNVLWPGDSLAKPIGYWVVPSKGRLRVGVPKKNGFTEFVNVQWNSSTNQSIVEGFSIDIFRYALESLPFKVEYDFVPFVNESGQRNGSYNDLLHKIKENDFDIVVADSTILAQRAEYVDFALPYSESGVVMVVKNNIHKDMWIFIKPLKWDLWLTIIAACIFLGFVVRVLEHRKMKNNNNAAVQPNRDHHNGFFFCYAIAVLAFPEGNMVSNNWSRFVLMIWVFMAFILAQSYTANLSAILTVDRFDSAFSKDYIVGYQEGSFVRDFLLKTLHVDKSKLKEFSTIEKYHDAMNKGGKSGGIDAIFDEIPYMKLFLRRYGSQYKIVGPIFKTDGFGFAFQQNSTLVPFFSRAILKVTQSENMTSIENKNFGTGNSISEPLSFISDDKPSLTAYNFGGLFIIIASATIFALFCSETPWGRRMVIFSSQFSQKTLDVVVTVSESFFAAAKRCNKKCSSLVKIKRNRPMSVHHSITHQQVNSNNDPPANDDDATHNNQVILDIGDAIHSADNSTT
ncbi:PREDICTED: glutamate receptor 2.2-like [Ipomoea nil]|uniref:glutamate receptor 2.2-like n=1 Tax=Ipomoea nil TaxID=35883 RepID=UPI000901F895|nr:PREDICTED: glutamate receptor 2.2-like [Ipomoea nil]